MNILVICVCYLAILTYAWIAYKYSPPEPPFVRGVLLLIGVVIALLFTLHVLHMDLSSLRV